MEHILQFAVSIDEEAIVRTATDRASEKIVAQVEDRIRSYGVNRYGVATKELESLFRDEIRKLLEDHKDEIIEKASKDLTSGMLRSKAVKEAIAKITENV